METPKDMKYAKTDEWIKLEGNVGTIGISDYAQEQLSDVVYVDIIPGVGDEAKKDTICATLESVKAAADVNFPVSGKVIAVNDALSDTPEIVNSDPYGSAWMIKIELSNPAELDSLMDADAYDAYCEEREH